MPALDTPPNAPQDATNDPAPASMIAPVPTRPPARDSEACASRFTEALLALESDGDGALDAMTGLFAGEARFSTPALRQAGEERSGGDGVRLFWSEYIAALGGARTAFHHVTIGERSVGLFWRTRGGAAGGYDGEFSYEGSTLLELDDAGRITGFQAFFDPRELDAKRSPPQAAAD